MKYLAKVVNVDPVKRILTARSNDNKLFVNVNIIKNGQPIPSVGDLVVIDDDLIQSEMPMYMCLGVVEFGGVSQETIQIPGQQTIDTGIQYDNSPLPVCEGDNYFFNPLYNSFIGLAGATTAIVNDIVSFLLDSANSEASLKAGQFSITTDHYDIQIDDTQKNLASIKVTGRIKTDLTAETFELLVQPDKKELFKLSISNSSGETFAVTVSHTGELTIDAKSNINITGKSLVAQLAAIVMAIEGPLSMDVKDLIIRAASINLAAMGLVIVTSATKLALGAGDAISIAAPEVSIDATGSPVSTPLSKKLIIRSTNGSIILSTPFLESSTSNSGILITAGYDYQMAQNFIPPQKGIGIFSQAPGGIVIGGPLPTPIGVNSFVKFNEFAMLMSALIGALITFATTQAGVASSSMPSLAPGYSALAAALGTVMPLVLPCKSITVTTGEP